MSEPIIRSARLAWHKAAYIGVSLYAVIGGATSLAGWVFDLPRLTDWDETGISIQPNTTLCVMLSGLGLLLLSADRRRAATACAALVLAIGGLTLTEWVTGSSFGIDALLLFGREWGDRGVVFPGRMGPPGSLSWTLIGLALIIAARARRPAPAAVVLAWITAVISSLSLLGYVYGVDQLFALPYSTVIALQTATFIMAMSLGILLGQPELEPVRSLLDTGAGGMLARRIMPFVVVLPVVIGYFRVRGQEAGLYGTGFGTALLVVALIVLLLTVVWLTLRAVRIHDRSERASRLRVAQTLESISDGFFSVDAAWRFTYVNREFERLYGLDRSAVVGRPYQDFFPPAEDAELFAELSRCKDSKTNVEFEHFHGRSRRWFFVRAYPTADGGFAEYFVDVSARKLAEQALRDSQRAEQDRRRELEAILAAAPAAIWVARDPDCRSIVGNPAAAALIRAAADSNMSKSDPNGAALRHFDIYRSGQLLSPEQLPIQTAARTGVAVPNQELEYRFSDGTSTWAYGNAVPIIDAQNEVRGAVGTFIDITPLRKAQMLLMEADRRKDEFLALLAHELRNPLAPARSAVELLRLKPSSREHADWALQLIERQLIQMTRLIDDLLDLSRVSLGKIVLKRDELDLVALLRDAVDASRPALDAQEQRIVVDMPASPMPIYADAPRLMQAFCNLLNNAAKFSNPGGRVEIALRRDAADCVVNIRDQGIGIPPHMLTQVFDMFTQVDQSLERARGGLGIGLTLVKQIVEMHGGDIEAHSGGAGAGAEFVVRLPAMPAATRDASAPPSESVTGAAGARRRVLVIDDNRDAATSLAMLLRVDGHEVRTGYDGLEALRLVEEFQPQAVLLDLGMPTLNGYETARSLRSRSVGANVTLIAVTGWGQDEDRKRSKHAGFDHHLVKPVDLDELRALLRAPPAGGAASAEGL